MKHFGEINNVLELSYHKRNDLFFRSWLIHFKSIRANSDREHLAASSVQPFEDIPTIISRHTSSLSSGLDGQQNKLDQKMQTLNLFAVLDIYLWGTMTCDELVRMTVQTSWLIRKYLISFIYTLSLHGLWPLYPSSQYTENRTRLTF